MVDRYRNTTSDVDSPAEFAYEISDSQDGLLTTPSRALYIGGSGNLYVRMVNTFNRNSEEQIEGANVLFQSCVAGTILPLRVSAVWSDNTTCTGLVALY